MYGPADARYDGSFQEVWMSCTGTGGTSIPGDTAIIATRTSYTGIPGKTSVKVYNRDAIYKTDGSVNKYACLPYSCETFGSNTFNL